jgi:antigen flippase
MTDYVTGLRHIAKSAAILGLSNVARVLIGMARTKVVAVCLGPSGVAILGLFTNLTTAASLVSTFGVDASGVRQIARAVAGGQARRVTLSARTLLIVSWLLGIAGALVFWFMRRSLARGFGVGLSVSGGDVGWLSLAVAFSVIGAGYIGFLTGFGRIRAIASINVVSAILWTLIAAVAVSVIGTAGIVPTVVAGPMCVLVLAVRAARGIVPSSDPLTVNEIADTAKELLKLGGILAVTGIAASASQLVVRIIIQSELGGVYAGYFQAAWLISVTILGATSTALSTEFYPRVSQAVARRDDANALTNHQLEVTASLFGPIVISVTILAPLIIRLAYSSDFSPAAVQLRWQVAGDLLRSITWPLGLFMLALGASRLYLALEVSWHVIYLVCLRSTLGHLGLAAVGQCFTLATVVYLGCELVILGRLTDFRLSMRNALLITISCCTSWLVTVFASQSALAAYAVGLGGVLALGAHALYRLHLSKYIARSR